MKIKKGDKVQIMRGKDKGKTGKVLRSLPTEHKVVVEGLNIRFRHLRPQKANEKGQRVEFSAPIPVSNVMLVCPDTSKPTRVGYVLDNDTKSRRSAKSKKAID